MTDVSEEKNYIIEQRLNNTNIEFQTKKKRKSNSMKIEIFAPKKSVFLNYIKFMMIIKNN